MPDDHMPTERVQPRPRPALQPRTRSLLKAVASLLRSVSPEDPETDILLHDMARQIEARLDAGDDSTAACAPAATTPGEHAWRRWRRSPSHPR